jgi:uncharacterized alkaline shock family protein YloU
VKRLWSLILGLLILVTVGTLLFLIIDYKDFTKYQEDLWNTSWFEPTIYSVAGVLLFIGLLYIIYALRPSYKSNKLVLNYADGEVSINKKSIEKNVLHTVKQYDAIRQPSIDVKLYQKKQSSYVDIKVDLFVTEVENIQSYLEQLRQHIKQNTEHFAELPVRDVTLNVLDQKTLKKRVL